MWKISELKATGKAAVKGNYWKSVLAAFLFSLTIGAAATGTASGNASEQLNDIVSGLTDSQILMLVFTVFAILSAVALIVKLVKIFVLNPLSVGCKAFFKNNCQTQDAELSDLGYGFRTNYWKFVGAVLLKDIMIFLWGLLLVIPGIIKVYSYRMVEFILIDNPEMPIKDAITLSRQMMNGNKWRAFLLDLSFIGWYFLSALTLGLVGLFWLSPYQDHTDAALYLALKEQQ